MAARASAPVCCGASSSTATTSTNGSTATRPSRRRRIPARAAAPRNRHWGQLALADVISMPDEWEYPWFAAWDLAFHAIPLAHVDPDFAKEQLVLMCREWSMHPNGQLPAYEWEFGDVNPPVHAWAAWHVYRIDGYRDREFLIRVFTKLLLNFSWWINRKDADGSNVFEGGFLGMDNIGLFNRSAQAAARATGWSSPTPPAGWRSTASRCSRSPSSCPGTTRPGTRWPPSSSSTSCPSPKAMNTFGSHDMSLWHEDDGFFYDVLVQPGRQGASTCGCGRWSGCCRSWAPPRCRRGSPSDVPDVTSRLRWLQRRRPELVGPLLSRSGPGGRRMLLSLLDPERLRRILERLFDSEEFLSAVRHPLAVGGRHGRRSPPRSAGSTCRSSTSRASRGPGCSAATPTGADRSGSRSTCCWPTSCAPTAGISATRSPIEIPTGSGNLRNAGAGGRRHRQRPDGAVPAGRRQAAGRRRADRGQSDNPLWSEHPTFSEYFDGDTGEGLGATHQTGWTALVAHLLNPRLPPDPPKKPAQ